MAAICRWIDWNRKQESSTANVEIAWKTLVWGFIYRYGTLLWLLPARPAPRFFY
jgi:hypothetical protein